MKLPDSRFAEVPENEFFLMRLAEESGLRVAEVELVPVAEIANLPREAQTLGGDALIVRRFDRDSGRRIHIEDFAQVLGIWPHRKYEGANYETIARILLAISGMQDVQEFVRRLVFVALTGNADAHTKNWSLIYPDAISARLAPAYDLLSTAPYDVDQRIGLTLGGARSFSELSVDSFRRLATSIELERDLVVDWVRDQVETTLSLWDARKQDAPARLQVAMDEHLQMLPLAGPRS